MPEEKKTIIFYDTSVVKRFHMLELEVIEYEKFLSAKKKKVDQAAKKKNDKDLFNWFTFGDEANQWYNYISERLTQARIHSELTKKRINPLRDRAYHARNHFYDSLHAYYDEVPGFRDLSEKTAFDYLEYTFQYIDLIHHAAVEPELIGYETVLDMRRKIENYFGSLSWLGPDASRDPEDLRKILARREETIAKEMKDYKKFQEILGNVGHDRHLSNQERKKLNKALHIKIPKVKILKIEKDKAK
ncbi:hypothetical protein ACFL2D_01975 [Patescibacteria group bacterium]